MLNMKVENPNAYRFIMPDDIYLLPQDKGVKTAIDNPDAIAETPAASAPVATAPAPQPQPIPTVTIPQIPAAPVTNVQTPAAAFNYMGGNNKKFLILVKYHDTEFIAPTHLNALESMLKRKDLSLDDVAILNINSYPQSAIADFNAFFAPQKLLIMGEKALPEGTRKPPVNKIFKSTAGDTLFSVDFEEMMPSNELKKAFWEQMKNL
jgi:hypothetical protein